MGAMVIHVAHRFKQAYLYIVRALLFHHSNFKNFTREQARTVTSPYQGRAYPLHHTEISCRSNSLFAL